MNVDDSYIARFKRLALLFPEIYFEQSNNILTAASIVLFPYEGQTYARTHIESLDMSTWTYMGEEHRAYEDLKTKMVHQADLTIRQGKPFKDDVLMPNIINKP